MLDACARIAPWGRVWLTCLGLSACAPVDTLPITLAGLPARSATLHLMATRNGAADRARPVLDISQAATVLREATMLVRLSDGVLDGLRLYALVYDQEGCLLASGDGRPTAMGGRIALQPHSGCPNQRETGPVLAAISPDRAPAEGGTPLELRGYGIPPGATVRFNGQALPDAEWISPFLIRVKAPPAPDPRAALGKEVRVELSDPASATIARADLFGYYEKTVKYSEPDFKSVTPGGISFGGFALGDVDGDKDLDMVLSRTGSQNLTTAFYLLRNGGQGAFAMPQKYDLQLPKVGTDFSYPDAAQLVDFNRDGAADLLLLRTDDSAQVRISDPKSMDPKLSPFPSEVTYQFKTGTQNLGVGDVDGDGTPDVVEQYWDGSVGGVRVYLGQRSDTEPLRKDAASDCAADFQSRDLRVSLADLNGDGRADIVVGNSINNGLIGVLLTDGAGRCGPMQRYLVNPGSSIQVTALGDVNGDGRPDIAAVGSSGVLLLLNSGDGAFGSFAEPNRVTLPASLWPDALGIWHLELTDLNGDRRPDLLLSYRTLDKVRAKLSVLFNQDGSIPALPAGSAGRLDLDLGERSPSSGPSGIFRVGDVNGDGRLDIVAHNSESTVNNMKDLPDIAVFLNQPAP